MTLNEYFEKIDALKVELIKLQPLKKEDEERLWKKFRLEWNYNSNHIEGNTLTYGQTELLLFFGKTTGDHPLRDIEEMKAHDVALRKIVEYAKDDERLLSEGDIRDLNSIILVEPFWKITVTESGIESRRQIIPGKYKDTPNHVRLATGEILRFAEPEEVPAKMTDLIDWLTKHLKSTETHPVWTAAMVHYKLVRIHPFGDGNGRVSRLVMNYVLTRCGYPPVIVKSADKENYLNALNKADTGDEESFVIYICKQLMWSLELSIKAAKGEDIEEPEDVDKEIAVWKKQLKDEKIDVIPKSDNQIYELYQSCFSDLFDLFIEKHKQFEDLFAKTEIRGWVNNGNKDKLGKEHIANKMKLLAEKRADLFDEGKTLASDEFDVLSVTIHFEGFKKDGVNAFDADSELRFEFQPYKYRIKCGTIKEKLYAEYIDETERKEIVKQCVKRVFDSIKQQIGKK